jgi:hypothetical protein
MGVIPANFASLERNYPCNPDNPCCYDGDKYKHVKQVMTGLTGTPCCVQMSHALNMAGINIPEYTLGRTPPRQNTPHVIDGVRYYYILATDELEGYMKLLTGDDGEQINKDLGNTRTANDIRKYISGRPGLLLFRYNDYGVPPPKDHFEHTELWDGTNILQYQGISPGVFNSRRVLMWDTNDPAQWLVDYMKTQA